ncbi:signal recognition particle-docking protein FtsY [Ramlibacter sp. AW1]|uniref:Signal recognition particle receptor FtsY n=1 Tax=Ramlibacter aurantiacus TaxID=2801330 RepID=A0A936ZVY3_9BURK|nr:signal recognition particle-docking protein FtsY [Ramlibacter aurantiacus]MBL0422115.1 signal recognition particle-docking protein FtsY [Ramlibacter aurantiacus]
MFSFFRKKQPPPPPPAPAPVLDTTPAPAPLPAPIPAPAPASAPVEPPPAPAPIVAAPEPAPVAPPPAAPIPSAPEPVESSLPSGGLIGSQLVRSMDIPVAAPPEVAPERQGWFGKLSVGLRKTGASLSQVFTGGQIDDALYEELESALLLADTGVAATEWLLAEVKRKVQATGATRPVQVRNILADVLTQLLLPLQKPLVIGEHQPTVIMVAGVNGAGKTTSIGKLTWHLARENATVLLAAADTFRAAAREQLSVWADRNKVEIVSQEGGDPAAVSFDAVSAGRARGKDVVLVDTAGRLPTQLHLMEELKKIKRVVQKADASAPHEVILVIDGNTGQNALAQVRSFDAALGLTGLVVTKLDGTAKGGVLAAIAKEKPVPVFFIGVGEKLDDLQTFNAREFSLALLGQA